MTKIIAHIAAQHPLRGIYKGVFCMNKLYYGDCLTIMQEMPMGSIDLVYLDPPFNSNRDYSAIYKDETGQPLPDQIEAFNDLWTLDVERERAIKYLPVQMRAAGLSDETAEFWRVWLNSMRKTQPRLLAYLSYMTERLLPLRGLLKPTGSIYLHCDPTASHYIKVMMDGVFGHENFLNEIVWHYGKYTNAARHYQKNHDIILVYCKKKNAHTFNKQFTEGAESTKIDYERGYRRHRPGGVPQLLVYDRIKAVSAIQKAESEGCKIVYREGKTKVSLPDVWKIPIIGSTSKERLGYATQKPLALLERVIVGSSNEGDVVFDPFCGCATTVEAAHKLGRKWIGIDIAIHAVKRVAKVRLEDRLGLKEGVDFNIEGVPQTIEGARDLWERDKFHFQKWAIEQIDGFVTTRKTGDGGIDGRLYFSLPDTRDLQSMVLEVKGGKNVNISVVRDLRGVLERDNALMAGLIVMDDLGPRKTASFKTEMAAAGHLEVNGVPYPKMQMLTVPDILEGKRFLTPSVARGKVQAQPSLPLG